MGNYWLDKAKEDELTQFRRSKTLLEELYPLLHEEFKKISELDCVVGTPILTGITIESTSNHILLLDTKKE